MSNSPLLSLTMIVKDEEEQINQCLKSVKEIVDEIIIVDTGSSDRTVDICRSFGAKIFSFPWNRSFSDARNYGLEQAVGSWILILDADEELDSEDRYKLKSLLNSDDYDLVSIRLLNYYGETFRKDQVTEMPHIRLLRNHMGFRYKNTIHETIDVNEILTDEKRILHADIKLHHYGYLEDIVKRKKKTKRNLDLLEKAYENDQNAWNCFYLAAEHYRLNQHIKALKLVNTSIVKFLMTGETPPSIAYKLKYTLLTDMGRWEESAKGIEKALLLYPDYVDLWFYNGIILFHKSKYSEALKAFSYCLDLGEENQNYYIVKGVGSFQAWFYKGKCLEKMQQPEEAAVCYLKALLISNNFKSAIDSLTELTTGFNLDIRELIHKNFSEKEKHHLLCIPLLDFKTD